MCLFHVCFAAFLEMLQSNLSTLDCHGIKKGEEKEMHRMSLPPKVQGGFAK